MPATETVSADEITEGRHWFSSFETLPGWDFVAGGSESCS